jgi:hypothetical protein
MRSRQHKPDDLLEMPVMEEPGPFKPVIPDMPMAGARPRISIQSQAQLSPVANPPKPLPEDPSLPQKKHPKENPVSKPKEKPKKQGQNNDHLSDRGSANPVHALLIPPAPSNPSSAHSSEVPGFESDAGEPNEARRPLTVRRMQGISELGEDNQKAVVRESDTSEFSEKSDIGKRSGKWHRKKTQDGDSHGEPDTDSSKVDDFAEDLAAIDGLPLMTFERARGRIFMSNTSNGTLPLHERVRRASLSLRAHSADSETTLDVMVSKSMIDDFFIAAHPTIVAAFTLKMPDDRPLQTRSSYLVTQGKEAVGALTGVGKHIEESVEKMMKTKKEVRETEEIVDVLSSKVDELKVCKGKLKQAVTESQGNGSFRQFMERVTMAVMAQIVWIFWMIIRLLKSPFLAPDQLPPIITVDEAKEKIVEVFKKTRERRKEEDRVRNSLDDDEEDEMSSDWTVFDRGERS